MKEDDTDAGGDMFFDAAKMIIGVFLVFLFVTALYAVIWSMFYDWI